MPPNYVFRVHHSPLSKTMTLTTSGAKASIGTSCCADTVNVRMKNYDEMSGLPYILPLATHGRSREQALWEFMRFRTFTEEFDLLAFQCMITKRRTNGYSPLTLEEDWGKTTINALLYSFNRDNLTEATGLHGLNMESRMDKIEEVLNEDHYPEDEEDGNAAGREEQNDDIGNGNGDDAMPLSPIITTTFLLLRWF
mmetsp:Transcript_1593/g.3430  ORF Transcript_1593/g.3430 Transcript_1593/m.3430 type:complete len:196 (-) Transcript_1593:81-668(-)